ncbi:hypothetical protein [Salinimicrobium sp. TH3]|uniref:hypothetical protein n=1 Tax=Salinimicrobium sp. TH3 TaxID=2997342 RepID=UPI002276E0EC|nr:hypothetical protein [Salinimicrobium sp. TH3]MCY2687961.1 hypothetical protein [Salinimicrobium sp. TH3]
MKGESMNIALRQEKESAVKPFFFKFSVNRTVWFWWFLTVVLAFFIQLLTIDVLPHLQQDEAQITDYGRLALDPNSEWSVTWIVEEAKPLLLWSYLGPLISEISFNMGGGLGIGPRIISLLGGVLAATVIFGWLSSRRVPVYAAFGLSVAFLLDPLFVLSQRMGRMDALVFTFCLLACWLLRLAENKIFKRGEFYTFAAGGSVAVAAFIWPSAIFLFPLIFMEFFYRNPGRKINDKWKYYSNKLFFFGIGGGTIAILLLIPIRNSIVPIFSDMGSMVTQNVDSSRTLVTQIFALFDFELWLKLGKVFVKTFSPLFPVFALAAILIRRDKSLIFALTVTLGLIFASLVYEFRAIYLLPVFVLLISTLFTEPSYLNKEKWIKSFNRISLIVLLFWSIGVSLGVRTIMGFDGKTDRSRDRILNVAEASIGKGDYKVFLDYTYEFYFVGRSLGWKIYIPYIQYSNDDEGNWIRNKDYEKQPEFTKLLSEMDFAVFSQGSVNYILQQQLSTAGLKFVNEFNLDNEKGINEAIPTSRNEEIMLGFLRGKESYGSYVLYGRSKNSNDYPRAVLK